MVSSEQVLEELWNLEPGVWVWTQGPWVRSPCVVRIFQAGMSWLSWWPLQVWRSKYAEIQKHPEVPCWLQLDQHLWVWTQMFGESVLSQEYGPSLLLAPPTSTRTPLWFKQIQLRNGATIKSGKF